MTGRVEHSPMNAFELGASLRRRNARPGRGAIAFSILLHVGIAAGLLLAARELRPNVPKFETVAIHLVSPPPTVKGPPAPVETTAPVQTTPKPQVVKTESAPKTKPLTQAAVPKPVVKKTEKKPVAAAGEHPKPVPIGGEDIDVQQEGAAFPDQEYLNNVVRQLQRYFRPKGVPSLSAEIQFFIRRDGSVGGIKPLRGSGNFQFDLQAVQAVEQAGRAGAFHALPAVWKPDTLWINFTFKPPK